MSKRSLKKIPQTNSFEGLGLSLAEPSFPNVSKVDEHVEQVVS